MDFAPETAALAFLSVTTFGMVAWGYQRSRKKGRVGLLAWGQSVSVTAPWLLFIAFTLLSIPITTIGLLMLLVSSIGAYIYLGNLRREAGQAEELKQKAIARIEEEAAQEQARVEQKEAAQEAAEPRVNPIDAEDLVAIKGIFGIDTFFSTESIPYQDGAIFKGNLRGDPEETHQKLTEKLGDRLGDKYRLFLVEDPEAKPVVIVLPSTNDPKTTTLAQKNIALVLLVATIATTLEALGILQGFDLSSDVSRYKEVLPLSLGIWAILGTHELAHWVTAEKYNVKLSVPFFLPNWQIGAFGSITRFESLLPTRSALFDIAIAGPLAGAALSLLMLVSGFILSQPGSIFQIPSQFFGGSVLVGTLAKIFMGDAIKEAVVAIHPLTILGWLGLVISALNLMPAGSLDGGRIIQAIYGRKTARRTTLATLVILGLVSLFNPANPIPLYWALIIAFLQRDAERPSLNELLEPDDSRALLGLGALLFMLLTLIPLTPSLAGQLGIG